MHLFDFARVLSVMAAMDFAPSQARNAQHSSNNINRRAQMIINRYPDGWPFLSHCINPESPGGLLNYELRTCAQDESPPFDTSSRIAIVGGGPSGILMAKLLDDRGFTDVTLFEKEDRVGGKSQNYVHENGDKFDLGTVWVASKYECIELLADQVGVSERPVNPDGNTPRFVSSDDAVLFGAGGMSAPNYGSVNMGLADYAFRTYGIHPTEYGTKFIQDGQAYISHRVQTLGFGSFEYVFPDEETLDFDALNQSFLSWLEERELYALISYLHVGFSAQGYGNLETIPAFYGLTWVHPNFFGALDGVNHSSLLEDWQTMFERILVSTSATVKLETKVVKIKRDMPEVVIEYIDMSARSNGKITEAFDFLIMASPMPSALSMLQDPTVEELELFGKFNYKSVRYDIGFLESTGVVEDSFNLFSWLDRLDKQTDYHVASLNEDGETERYVIARDGIDGALTISRLGRVDAGAVGVGGDFSRATNIFSISPIGTTEEEVRSLLQADLDAYDMDMSFVYTKIWPDYFPWKNLTQVVDERMPWRIWDAQGTASFANTWYVGSYVSFESVADVMDYNMKMINEKLCSVEEPV